MILLIEYFINEEDIGTIPLQGDTIMDIQDQMREGDEILGFLLQSVNDQTQEIEYFNLEILN